MNRRPEEFDPVDGALAGKLREVSPPADLRRRLLALAPAEKPPTWLHWMRYGWVGVAAILVVAVFADWMHVQSAPLGDARADLTAFVSHPFTLDMETDHMDVVRHWFRARNPDGPHMSLPAGLADKNPVGCCAMKWHGIEASLICFNIGGSNPAHLFVFPNNTFGRQVSASPDMIADKGWTSTAWTDGSYDYVMLSPGGTHEAQQLMAAMLLRPPELAWAAPGSFAEAF